MLSQQSQYPTTGGHLDHHTSKIRRTKCILYILLFILFQTTIITLFALTLMQIRTPKFRIAAAAITSFSGGTTARPSLTARLNVEFSVRNTNFGSTVTGTPPWCSGTGGRRWGAPSRVNWRSTEKVKVEVDLNLVHPQMDSELRKDLNAGVIPITSEGRLRGRVEVVVVMKKNKSSRDMNCSMVIAAQQIRDIVCL